MTQGVDLQKRTSCCCNNHIFNWLFCVSLFVFVCLLLFVCMFLFVFVCFSFFAVKQLVHKRFHCYTTQGTVRNVLGPQNYNPNFSHKSPSLRRITGQQDSQETQVAHNYHIKTVYLTSDQKYIYTGQGIHAKDQTNHLLHHWSGDAEWQKDGRGAH